MLCLYFLLSLFCSNSWPMDHSSLSFGASMGSLWLVVSTEWIDYPIVSLSYVVMSLFSPSVFWLTSRLSLCNLRHLTPPYPKVGLTHYVNDVFCVRNLTIKNVNLVVCLINLHKLRLMFPTLYLLCMLVAFVSGLLTLLVTFSLLLHLFTIVNCLNSLLISLLNAYLLMKLF